MIKDVNTISTSKPSPPLNCNWIKTLPMAKELILRRD